MKSLKLFAAAFGCAVAAGTSAASAAVIGATVADASSGDYTLTSVSVNRSGAGAFTYEPFQLTNVTLTDVAAVGSLPVLLVPEHNAPVPAQGTRAALLEDWRLDSGILAPFSSANPPLNSFEVTFLQPVVNSSGEDILVFDVGSVEALANESTLFFIDNDNSTNDGTDRHQQVGGANFATNLLQLTYTTFEYSNSGDRNFDSLTELETAAASTIISPANGTSNVAAVGLDLSDFGVAPGATITSLRFQTLAGSSGRIDPVLIVGLPAVPEPAGLAVVGLGTLALLRRRRA